MLMPVRRMRRSSNATPTQAPAMADSGLRGSREQLANAGNNLVRTQASTKAHTQQGKQKHWQAQRLRHSRVKHTGKQKGSDTAAAKLPDKGQVASVDAGRQTCCPARCLWEGCGPAVSPQISSGQVSGRCGMPLFFARGGRSSIGARQVLLRGQMEPVSHHSLWMSSQIA